eukprot:478583-Pelagomonas_calceolata.AAC.3
MRRGHGSEVGTGLSHLHEQRPCKRTAQCEGTAQELDTCRTCPNIKASRAHAQRVQGQTAR